MRQHAKRGVEPSDAAARWPAWLGCLGCPAGRRFVMVPVLATPFILSLSLTPSHSPCRFLFSLKTPTSSSPSSRLRRPTFKCSNASGYVAAVYPQFHRPISPPITPRPVNSANLLLRSSLSGFQSPPFSLSLLISSLRLFDLFSTLAIYPHPAAADSSHVWPTASVLPARGPTSRPRTAPTAPSLPRHCPPSAVLPFFPASSEGEHRPKRPLPHTSMVAKRRQVAPSRARASMRLVSESHRRLAAR